MTVNDKNTLRTTVQERYRDAGQAKGKARQRRPVRPCQFEGCEDWAWARGYCGSHYQRLRGEGKLPTVRIMKDPVARFNASYEINPMTGCWEWTGWIHPKGYGILPLGGKSKKIRAHRFSWELHFGPIPDGVLVLHKCDNRRCCNHKHLFLGDHEDNGRDMVEKDRQWSKPGVAGRKITKQMALNIRVMFARGNHSMQSLADIYGVDQKTISLLLKARSHLHV